MATEKNEFSSGELTARTGVDRSTLRFYEGLGLFQASRRTAGGLRRYSEQDLQLLLFIHRLGYAGVPIENIRELIYGAPGRKRSLAEAALKDVDSRIGGLQALRETLVRMSR